eukprot:50007_1
MSVLREEDIQSFAFQISTVDEFQPKPFLSISPNMDEIERRIESDPEPAIFRFYINFQFSKFGPYIVIVWWFCMILAGVFYGFDVLNLTVFSFSAPSGTDGYTADQKMKQEFKSISDSRQLLIYYKCDQCGNSTGHNYPPIQWTPYQNYTPKHDATYLGW